MRPSARATLLALCAAYAAVGCGDYYGDEYASSEGSRAASVQEDRATLDAIRSTPEDEPPPELSSYFKNKMDFTLDDLRAGATNCRDVLRYNDLAKRVVAWPKELQGFLVKELERFPALPLLHKSLHGLYLVHGEVMTDANGSVAAGIACDRGDNRGIIFLNYDSFVKDRRRGPGVWQNLRVVTDRHILQEAGDNAAVTLIHEILHAIDNKLFVHGELAMRKMRLEVFQLSWRTYTEPKARRISVYAMADDAAAEAEPDGLAELRRGLATAGYGCRRTQAGLAPTVRPSSEGKTPAELAEDLRYLAESTNFIVPYAMASAAEDFAETMTVYHFGVHRGSWQVRSVYEQDLREVAPVDGTKIYTHDSAEVLRRSKRQVDKTCALAKLVFGSCKISSRTR